MAFAALLLSSVVLADDAGLMRCRAIGDSAARLACYDALAKQVEGRFGQPKASAPTVAAPAASAPAASAPAPTAPAAPSQTAAAFGLENRQPLELQSIRSHIPGRFEGWKANSRIQLANGQVWQITDGSSVMMWLENPKVEVRRGALGSFFLDIENDKRSPRVKRIQ
jgi:hypothetical protein